MVDGNSFASAEPEKRLFISLLTRDISLVDAVLDLIDNSINSAIILSRMHLSSPADYVDLLEVASVPSLPSISIEFNETRFVIQDTCGGIDYETAASKVFRFGRDYSDDGDSTEDEADEGDRLSVYGIGLKRAIFKIGDHVEMSSAHPDGGFSMDLHVGEWGKLKQDRWQIPIKRFENNIYGTSIVVSDLYADISRRIDGGTFGHDLERRIARTYNYFLNKIVKIEVNGVPVQPVDISYGANKASDAFVIGKVSCAVVAGIGIPNGKFHTAEVAGWYVYCNGRAVAFADKSELTGWGTYLPSFQPKHRPFVGNVFFTSEHPELLPWTTTKSSINRESAVWQHALTVMGAVGKQITSYLDGRYDDDGTDITVDELRAVAGKAEPTLRSISSAAHTFRYERVRRQDSSVQFRVLNKDLVEIKAYLGRRSMSNGEAGRYTFDYFLNNVVRE